MLAEAMAARGSAGGGRAAGVGGPGIGAGNGAGGGAGGSKSAKPARPGGRANPGQDAGLGTSPDAAAESWRLRVKLVSDPDSVRVALAQIGAHLLARGIGADSASTAEQVLAEVLNNIVEHAFGGRSDGRIELEVSAAADHLAYEVRDNGQRMPGDRLPPGLAPATDVALADLPEGGFGWFLIQSLAEELSYRRDAEGNRLSFRVPIAASAAVT